MAIVISVVLLFTGISLLIFIHACIVGRSFRSNRTTSDQRNRDPENSDEGTATRMSKDDLEKLPVYDFIGKNKGNNSPIDCVICLENFKVSEKCRLLPICKHSFHANCVDEWLVKMPICPICRASITTAGFDDSRESLATDSSRYFSDESVQERINNGGSQLIENQTNLVVTVHVSSVS